MFSSFIVRNFDTSRHQACPVLLEVTVTAGQREANVAVRGLIA